MNPKHKKLLLLYKTNLPNELIRLIVEHYPVMNDTWFKSLKRQNDELLEVYKQHKRKLMTFLQEDNEAISENDHKEWLKENNLNEDLFIRFGTFYETSKEITITAEIGQRNRYCTFYINKNKTLKLVRVVCDRYSYYNSPQTKTLHEVPADVLIIADKVMSNVYRVERLRRDTYFKYYNIGY